MAEGEYAKTARTTLNRLKARGKYDYATIHNIIDSCPVLHVSFNPTDPDEDPFPTTLPMLGCSSSRKSPPEPQEAHDAPGTFPADEPEPTYDDGPRHIYLHGYVSSRLMKLPEAGTGPRRDEGTPICIAASFMDGIVLALTPFHNSCNYRSAVVHGFASIVTDEVERMHAMHLITDNVLKYRWNNSRTPPTKAELSSTGILRVEIVSASAKVRIGGPGDDRHDLKDPNVIGTTWTGVIPAYLHYETPEPSDYNQVSKVPFYISEWVKEENQRNRNLAIKAMVDPSKKKSKQ